MHRAPSARRSMKYSNNLLDKTRTCIRRRHIRDGLCERAGPWRCSDLCWAGALGRRDVPARQNAQPPDRVRLQQKLRRG